MRSNSLGTRILRDPWPMAAFRLGYADGGGTKYFVEIPERERMDDEADECDRLGDENVEKQQHEELLVIVANAVGNPWAMMIHIKHASVAQ